MTLGYYIGIFVLNSIKMIVQIEVPDSVFQIPSYSQQDMLIDLAVALYQRKLYSLAKAASFARVNRIEFQHILADRLIPINYDLQIDIESLQSL